MTWLAGRQHRGQLLVTAGLLAVLGTVLVVHSIVVADQLAEFAADEADRLARLAMLWSDGSMVLPWLAAVPAAVGLFWGAPLLARKYERGTHQVLVRLGELAGAVVLAGLAFGVLLTAWADVAPVTEAGRVESLFVVTGVVPAAWWLLAFVLGTTVGTLVRRLLPAVAVTLAVFLAAYGAVFALDVRENYVTPERVELTTPHGAGEAWRLSPPTGAEWNVPAGALRVDHRRFAAFHSADRYWRFQWTEAGILLLATTLLGGALAPRVARRGAST